MQVPQWPLPVQQRPDLLSHSPCYWAATLGHKAAELGEKGRSWWLGGEGAGPAVFSCSAGFYLVRRGTRTAGPDGKGGGGWRGSGIYDGGGPGAGAGRRGGRRRRLRLRAKIKAEGLTAGGRGEGGGGGHLRWRGGAAARGPGRALQSRRCTCSPTPKLSRRHAARRAARRAVPTAPATAATAPSPLRYPARRAAPTPPRALRSAAISGMQPAMCSANVCIVLTPLVQTDQLSGMCGGGGGGGHHRAFNQPKPSCHHAARRDGVARHTAAALLTLLRCVHVFMLLTRLPAQKGIRKRKRVQKQ